MGRAKADSLVESNQLFSYLNIILNNLSYYRIKIITIPKTTYGTIRIDRQRKWLNTTMNQLKSSNVTLSFISVNLLNIETHYSDQELTQMVTKEKDF